MNTKRIVGLVAALWLCAAGATAQTNQAPKERPWRIGVVGGLNQTQLENYGGGAYVLCDFETRWQVGVAFQYSQLFRGSKLWDWSVQPELRYMTTATYIEPIFGQWFGATKMELIDLPVNAQFGLRLSPIFRPFVSAGVSFSYTIAEEGELFEDNFLPTNKAQFGLGAGVGFDLWKFQFQARYRWNLTRTNANKEVFDRLVWGGFECSIGILF